MKYLFIILAIWVGLGSTACNPPAPKTGTADSTADNVIPPKADNSQATNPSLADTAFAKKDSVYPGPDSGRSKK